jgi:hypothetical protein
MNEPAHLEKPLNPAWQNDLLEALRALERARSAAPLEASRLADQAEVQVVHVRDELIERLRREPEDPQAANWRQQLDRANASLSLIAGVEYPTSGLRRGMIDQAYALLSDLLNLTTSGASHG